VLGIKFNLNITEIERQMKKDSKEKNRIKNPSERG
jgi:hypothetical protein